MNVYDFDKTIYGGDSTADFYLFSLKRHKKILLLAPSLFGAFLKFYLFKKGSKTDFKQVMYRFLKCSDTQQTYVLRLRDVVTTQCSSKNMSRFQRTFRRKLLLQKQNNY